MNLFCKNLSLTGFYGIFFKNCVSLLNLSLFSSFAKMQLVIFDLISDIVFVCVLFLKKTVKRKTLYEHFIDSMEAFLGTVTDTGMRALC